jgi:hypothetical protein
MKEFSSRQKVMLVFCVAILLTLTIFALSKELWVSASRIVSSIKTPSLSDPYAEDISVLETNVANSPNEEARRVEEDRLQTIGREATFVAEGRAAAELNGPGTPIPTQFINATLQAIEQSSQKQWGIIDNPSVPLPSAAFLAENAWKQDMGDGYILVFAGYSPANPEKGVLYVVIDRKNLHTSRTFVAPGNSGSIHIVKAISMRLVLEANNRETLYFDIPGLSFTNSLEEIVPTATELVPIITPIFTETPLPPYP